MKHGVGILKFKGGNEYTGEFINDKREGYGVYRWSDSRKFKGWWYDNKQHGLGVYYSPDNGDKPRFGIWQMGKRLRYLSEIEASQILDKSLDYVSFF